jgi:large subunit ribosomal protein L22
MAKGHRSQIKKARNAIKDKRPKASAKFIRLSDTKARIVLNEIKGKDAIKAVALLKYSPRYASSVCLKILQSAIANAENNLDMDVSKLYIEEVFADQGPTMKRFRARARGNANRISKRTSHISIILNER